MAEAGEAYAALDAALTELERGRLVAAFAADNPDVERTTVADALRGSEISLLRRTQPVWDSGSAPALVGELVKAGWEPRAAQDLVRLAVLACAMLAGDVPEDRAVSWIVTRAAGVPA